MSDKRNYRKDVSDEEIRVAMRVHLSDLMASVVPRTLHEDAPSKQTDTGPVENVQSSRTHADETQLAYLRSIATHPNLTTSGRALFLGLSSYQNNRIKRTLLTADLVSQYAINLGGVTRGIVKLLELTSKGYELLGLSPEFVRPENVSGEHFFWQREIARYYTEQGAKAVIEMALKNVRADVGVIVDQKRIAIEVGISAANQEAVNAVRDLEAGFDEVIIAARNSGMRKAVGARLQSVLSPEQIATVTLMELSEFPFVKTLFKPGVRTDAVQET